MSDPDVGAGIASDGDDGANADDRSGSYRYGPRGEKETMRRGWGPVAGARAASGPQSSEQSVSEPASTETTAPPVDEPAPAPNGTPEPPIEGAYMPPPGDHASRQAPPPPPWPSGPGPGPGPGAGNGRGGSGWRTAAQGPNRNRWVLPLVILGAALLVALVRSHRISTTDIVVFCCIVPSIILHEVSHGWVALAFGDDTAKRAGRLTLNPIAHVDLVGTIIVPAVLALGGYGAFGWAKPVPVNVGRLRSPRNQSTIVALAGPATNILIAAVSALVFTLIHGIYTVDLGHVTFGMVVFYLGLINLWLAMFNLIPIPPLDGSALLERALPSQWWPGYLRLRQYAMPLVMVLVLINLNMHPGPITWLFEEVERLWINVLIHLA